MAVKKKFQELEFKDSFMFAILMSNPETCRGVLERVLGIPIRKVVVHSEHSLLLNPDLRGVRLDVYADDEVGTIYNIEMQTVMEPSLPKRSRLYQSQMDVSYMKPGDSYDKLPESLVIFICCFDPFGRGRYRYTYQESCIEDGEPLGDGTRKLFLSTKGKNSDEVPPELIRFLDYVESPESFSSGDPDALINHLQQEVLDIKRSRSAEERYMQFQEILKKEREEGIELGKEIGTENGLYLMGKLFTAMQNDNREEEYARACMDPEFRNELLKQYDLA